MDRDEAAICAIPLEQMAFSDCGPQYSLEWPQGILAYMHRQTAGVRLLAAVVGVAIEDGIEDAERVLHTRRPAP